MDNKLIELGAFWNQADKNGKHYLSGSLNNKSRLLIFPNKYKEKDNQPDFILYIAPSEKKEGTGEKAPF